jgi:peptidoglycan/LPS O-acetylase OafA/YrhL
LNHWIGIFAAHALFGRLGLRDTLASNFGAVILSVAVAALLYAVVDRRVMAARSRHYTAQRGVFLATLGFALVITGFVGAYFYGQLS